MAGEKYPQPTCEITQVDCAFGRFREDQTQRAVIMVNRSIVISQGWNRKWCACPISFI